MKKILVIMLAMVGLNSLAQNKTIGNNYVQTECSQDVVKKIKIIYLQGGRLTFTGRYWGSVGYTYEIEFDKDACNMQSKLTYNHPEEVAAHMCGGDEGTLSFTIKPRKKGEFTVIEIFKFRGQETKRIINTIVVK